MAKHHHTPRIPVTPAGRYRPGLEQKRAMLIAMRDNFRAQGYESELNVEALRVQEVPDDAREATEKKLEDLMNSIANSDRAARRMDELLAKLPEPKPPAATA